MLHYFALSHTVRGTETERTASYSGQFTQTSVHKGHKPGTLLLPKHTSSTIINNKQWINVITDTRMESGSSILQEGKKTDLQLLHEWHTVTLQLSQSCVGEM